jgi:hypothetical protein
MQDNLNRELHC